MSYEEIFAILYAKETWNVYHQFVELENSIDSSNHLYQYFDQIQEMLVDERSFIKMRGFRLIAKLAQYDSLNKINDHIDIILAVLDNDKPTIVRECLAALPNLLLFKKELKEVIKNKLLNLNYLKYKDTMRPLIKKDIDLILTKINAQEKV